MLIQHSFFSLGLICKWFFLLWFRPRNTILCPFRSGMWDCSSLLSGYLHKLKPLPLSTPLKRSFLWLWFCIHDWKKSYSHSSEWEYWQLSVQKIPSEPYVHNGSFYMKEIPLHVLLKLLRLLAFKEKEKEGRKRGRQRGKEGGKEENEKIIKRLVSLETYLLIKPYVR